MTPAVRIAKHIGFCLFDTSGMGATFKARERFNLAVFVSPKRDFLFTKNEKCGNNTVRMTLQHLAAEKPLAADFRDSNRWFAPLLQPSDLGLKEVGAVNAIPFKFAVVRNPYTRILSCYLNKFAPGFRKREKYGRIAGGGADIDFATFVSQVAAQTPDEMDPHWRIQYHNIFCGIIRYDRFVCFESMDAEIGAIVRQFSPGAPIRNVRKGQYRAGEKIAEYYTPAIARMVHDTFALDFETFGYADELPA
jgi:Sulfotransferase family